MPTNDVEVDAKGRLEKMLRYVMSEEYQMSKQMRENRCGVGLIYLREAPHSRPHCSEQGDVDLD